MQPTGKAPLMPSWSTVEVWKLRVIAALIVCVMVVTIHPFPYVRPELWAEDGAEILAGPLVEGFWSCLRPLGSNFIVLPRLVAWVAVSVFPLAMLPHIIVWWSLVTTGIVLSSLLRDDMAWIHPDRRWRFALVVSLGLLPSLAEVAMALCNWTYVCGLAAYLLCLRDRPRPTVPYVVGLWLLMLSGTVTILVPLIWMWRALVERDERATHLKLLALSAVPWLVVMVPSALLNPFIAETGIVYLQPPPVIGLAPFDAGQLLGIFVSRLGVSVVGLPLLGVAQTSALMAENTWFWLTPVVAVGLLVLFWRVQPRLVIGVLLGVVLFPLVQLARNYGPMIDVSLGRVLEFYRWSLIAQCFTLIALFAAISRAPRPFRVLLVVPVVQLALATTATSHITTFWDAYPIKPFWLVTDEIDEQRRAVAAGEVEEALTPIIPVQPWKWASFQIRLR